ncbi:MAG: hypothetical protein II837_14005 [Treponema sp.]|nr:hypothetical protein [Treponema sp.]
MKSKSPAVSDTRNGNRILNTTKEKTAKTTATKARLKRTRRTKPVITSLPEEMWKKKLAQK